MAPRPTPPARGRVDARGPACLYRGVGRYRPSRIRRAGSQHVGAGRLSPAPRAGIGSFARAWDTAVAHAADRLTDIAFQRAIEGTTNPVYDCDGIQIGTHRRYNDRLLMFLLRAYRPSGTALPMPPIAPALAALVPQPPPNPHAGMAPERLEALAEGTRARGEVYACDPDLDREKYAEPMQEPTPPIVERRRNDRLGLPTYLKDDAPPRSEEPFLD